MAILGNQGNATQMTENWTETFGQALKVNYSDEKQRKGAYIPLASVNNQGQPRMNLLPFQEVVEGDAKYIVFSGNLENKELIQVMKRNQIHELVW